MLDFSIGGNFGKEAVDAAPVASIFDLVVPLFPCSPVFHSRPPTGFWRSTGTSPSELRHLVLATRSACSARQALGETARSPPARRGTTLTGEYAIAYALSRKA